MAERSERIRIAVSGCLLGEKVRYDGGHREHGYVTAALGTVFDLVAECPEAGIGLGVPRPKIHLEPGAAGARLQGADGRDLTAVMERYAAAAAERFRRAGVAGVVLKSRSPSCGIGDARVRQGDRTVGRADGVFAGTLRVALPEAPLIRECDLDAPAERDDWLTRVFAGAELRMLEMAQPVGMEALFRFHARWKMVLMAHSEASARRLGRLLAAAPAAGEVVGEYGAGVRAALARPSSPGAHENVLSHLAGHLKKVVGPSARARIHRAIREYREGRASLAAPTALIAREARRRRVGSLLDQAALDPRAPALRYRAHGAPVSGPA